MSASTRQFYKIYDRAMELTEDIGDSHVSFDLVNPNMAARLNQVNVDVVAKNVLWTFEHINELRAVRGQRTHTI